MVCVWRSCSSECSTIISQNVYTKYSAALCSKSTAKAFWSEFALFVTSDDNTDIIHVQNNKLVSLSFLPTVYHFAPLQQLNKVFLAPWTRFWKFCKAILYYSSFNSRSGFLCQLRVVAQFWFSIRGTHTRFLALASSVQFVSILFYWSLALLLNQCFPVNHINTMQSTHFCLK